MKWGWRYQQQTDTIGTGTGSATVTAVGTGSYDRLTKIVSQMEWERLHIDAEGLDVPY